MAWNRDRRLSASMWAMAVLWAFFCVQRIIAMSDSPHRLVGDGVGLIGAILAGIVGHMIIRDADFPARARFTLRAGWTLFFIYTLSDFLDEFLLPEANPILGKNQPLHRALEIVLWTGGYMLAMYGLAQVAVDSIASRRDARAAHARGDASLQETARTQEQLAVFALAIEQARESIVVIDLDAKILFANAAFHEMLRLPPGTAVGMDAKQLNKTKTAPAGTILAAVLRDGSWVGEVEGPLANGDSRVVRAIATLFRDNAGAPAGVVILARDVTEERRLQSALRASEERYRIIAEQATDLISTHSRDSNWLYVSPSVENILGYKPEELIGREAYEIMDPGQATMLNDLDPADFLDPQPVPVPVMLRHKDGHIVHLESRIRTITQADSELPPQVLVMSRDVSERVRHEEERRQLDIKLHRAQRHESLTLLAGGVAHDFNNLLLVILANADLIMTEIGTETPAQPFLRAIQTASERAGDLTRQMLAYTGKGQPTIRSIHLGEAVSEMTSLLQASIPARVRLELAVKPSTPPIEGDITEIRQVIMNLITNASEAIGANDGLVRISTGVCQCDAAYLASCVVHDRLPDGAYVYIEVSDSGAGMDDATRERIFDPFFTTKFTGRGLGLASVLGIVRRHHGTLKLDSLPGKGTTMRVLFPCADIH